MRNSRKNNKKISMKRWRFISFDDGFGKNFACIVGCITAGSEIEGFVYSTIEIDGFDVTHKIISLVNTSKFKKQIKCIFLGGITFAGFNIADIHEISNKTGKPVVVIMRKRPNFDRIKNALKNLSNYEKRMELIKKAGEIRRVSDLYIQVHGCSFESAKEFIECSKSKGKIPEGLRIAHLVASAIVHGESKKGS